MFAQTNPAGAPDNTEPPSPSARRKFTKVRAETRVGALRRPVPQDALARRWGVTEAAISQWVGDWDRRVVVTRVRRGRCNMVRPIRRLKLVRAA